MLTRLCDVNGNGSGR